MPNWCYNNLRVETADNWSPDTDEMEKERENGERIIKWRGDRE